MEVRAAFVAPVAAAKKLSSADQGQEEVRMELWGRGVVEMLTAVCDPGGDRGLARARVG